jgi:hypothetical protein
MGYFRIIHLHIGIPNLGVVVDINRRKEYSEFLTLEYGRGSIGMVVREKDGYNIGVVRLNRSSISYTSRPFGHRPSTPNRLLVIPFLVDVRHVHFRCTFGRTQVEYKLPSFLEGGHSQVCASVEWLVFVSSFWSRAVAEYR